MALAYTQRFALAPDSPPESAQRLDVSFGRFKRFGTSDLQLEPISRAFLFRFM